MYMHHKSAIHDVPVGRQPIMKWFIAMVASDHKVTLGAFE